MKSICFCFAIALISLTGCSSEPTNSPTTTQPVALGVSQGTACKAECLVCKKNADLACVDVQVDSQTPAYVYNGKTYYFCSDDCREEFVKHPSKYASK
jgi:YHS domain-containing protein